MHVNLNLVESLGLHAIQSAQIAPIHTKEVKPMN